MKKISIVITLCLSVWAMGKGIGKLNVPDAVIAYQDSIPQLRAKYMAEVNKMIKGKENISADSVYKNLQYIGGCEASLLPEIMDKWSIALGVNCTYCHNTGKWEADEKPEKIIARQMAEFSYTVRQELRKIKGLKSTKPTVNCMTCHNGRVKPALR